MYNSKLHFHFTGIGGVGMSGIAEILLKSGFTVSGSDLRVGDTCRRLKKQGAAVFKGHSPTNLPPQASLLVYSSAVKENNVEIAEAKKRGIPVVRRAEVLAELMRLKYGVAVAGSHGKTTTTSMIAHVIEQAGLDPTVIIGGQVKSLGGRCGKLGNGDYLVAESDESDKSFLLLKPSVAVVTNIDFEHLDAYSSMSEIEDSFKQFVDSVPFYGLAVLCLDDPRVRELSTSCSRRKLTYGLSPESIIRAQILSQKPHKTLFKVYHRKNLLFEVNFPLPGIHMVSNSLAAVAVALEFDISPGVIKEALESFSGVKRRLEVTGTPGGITVISDYAHHPTEIKATVNAVRSGRKGKMGLLHAVFQPHRYTRTKSCFTDFLTAFSGIDNLVVTDIYAAGEEQIEGITSANLVEAMIHPSKHYVSNPDDAIPGLIKTLSAGDIVLCLGAGSIGELPPRLCEAIAATEDQ